MGYSIICILALLVVLFSEGTYARQILVKKVAAGSASTCVVLENGKVKCFGSTTGGVLANGSPSSGTQTIMGDDLAEANIGVLAKDIVAGFDHYCVLSMDNAVKCWGSNRRGACGQFELGNTTNLGDNPDELGDGLPFVNLGPGRTAVQLALGPSFSCAILDDGTVKCWGHNTSGRLGQSTSVSHIADPSSIPPIDFGVPGSIKQICAGGYFTTQNYLSPTSEGFACAILADDSLRCWGEGSSGQLGTGSTADIGTSITTGTNMQSNINLGTGRTAKQITCGARHTCVLLDNNTIRCFGRNDQGQLGIGTTDDSGAKIGDDLDLVQLPAGRHAIKIVAGGSTTCAILDDRSGTCWGNGISGQLLRGFTIDALFGDEAMIFRNGTFRKNRFASLSLSEGLFQMPSRAGHTCAILSDSLILAGDLVCWGMGTSGQLGYGTVGASANLGEGEGEEGTDTFPAYVDLGTIEDEGTTNPPSVSDGETPSTSPSQAPNQNSPGGESSSSPTISPSFSPTKATINVPTKSPSQSPSKFPSVSPLTSENPAVAPTNSPTVSPTNQTDSDSNTSESLDTQTVNTIAGVAAVVGVGAMAVGAFLYFRRRKRLRTPASSVENTNAIQLIQHQDPKV